MDGRRRFLGQVAAGAGGLVIGRAGAALGDMRAEEPTGDGGEYAWQRTLLCQTTQAAVLAAVGAEAMRLPCEIFLGDPQSPDIYAIPCFAIVLDRRPMGLARWRDYLSFRAEVEDETPILIVDLLDRDPAWTRDRHTGIVDPGSETDLLRMRRVIRMAHAVAQTWRADEALDLA